MNAEQFKAWRKQMGFSQAKAAKALGINAQTVFNYEKGSRPESDKPVAIPRPIALACSALYHRLEEWEP